MTTILQRTSVKSLAFRVLQEVAARSASPRVCPTPAEHVEQDAGQDTSALKAQRDVAPTGGSPHCAGCYDVGDGRKIHLPKIGEDYRKWLERWQPKGKPQ